MKHIVLLSSLLGLALCGDLSNEYLPANLGGRSFGQSSGSSFNTYSPFSRSSSFGGGFGTPSSQYGAPSTLNRQFGGQHSTSRFAPTQLYGAPSQYSRTSSFGASTPYSSSQFSQPQSQYGAPSYSGQYRSGGVSSYSSQYPSQFGQSFGVSSQYGAPQQYQSGFPSAAFRSGSHFGGVPSSQGVSSYRSSSAYSGTVQDSNGGYVY